MPDKIKLLFFVSEFYQAGTERFTYEVDRALDKSRFTVDILCYYPLNASDRFTDYYYEKHQKLGTQIFFLDDVDIIKKPTIKDRVLKRLGKKSLPHEHEKLRTFLNQYDCISIMGEYNYKGIERWMTEAQKKKTLIHIQNSRHQKSDLYNSFNKQEYFHFVSGFTKPEIKWELSEFPAYRHTYFSLNFKLENQYVKTNYTSGTKKKIGIFTRLTNAKPLDPFIYSFQLVLERFPGSELHIYGSGDPEAEGVNRYVRQLGLTHNVFFRGHQEQMLKTAFEDDLDLVWLHGYHGTPGGWAGFDICTTKIPQVFWDFGGSDDTTYNPQFPMFNRLSQFVYTSIDILEHPDKAKDLAQKQFDYIDENHNIQRFIHVLENAYIEIKNQHAIPKNR